MKILVGISIGLLILSLIYFIQSIFWNIQIRKFLKSKKGEEIRVVDNLHCSLSTIGFSYNLPSGGDKISIYVFDDIILIVGKLNIFGIFNATTPPLILKSKRNMEIFFPIRNFNINKIHLGKVRTKLEIFTGTNTRIVYTMGFNQNSRNLDKEILGEWFERIKKENT